MTFQPYPQTQAEMERFLSEPARNPLDQWIKDQIAKAAEQMKGQSK